MKRFVRRWAICLKPGRRARCHLRSPSGALNISPIVDPYRRIGDEIYPSLYDLYAEEFVGVPAPKGLTPVDLAFIVALGGQHDLTVDATAEHLRTDPAWKYALHLPLDHPGCSADALWRFVKRTEGPRCPQRVPIGFIIEMVRRAFTPRQPGA